LNKGLLSEIKGHLLSLKEELSRYFPDIKKLFSLVKSPFTFGFDEIPEFAQEELIKIMIGVANMSFLPFRKHSLGLKGLRLFNSWKN
jgi:hypothetical protein